MPERNYTVRELCCSCGNEARYTTINGMRRCGVCVADNKIVSVADNRIPELLVLLHRACDWKDFDAALRDHIRSIIGHQA